MKDDLSKSELFELSGEYSSGNSNLDELNSLEFSNLDLDVCFYLNEMYLFNCFQIKISFKG
jgi:hypothetical protein